MPPASARTRCATTSVSGCYRHRRAPARAIAATRQRPYRASSSFSGRWSSASHSRSWGRCCGNATAAERRAARSESWSDSVCRNLEQRLRELTVLRHELRALLTEWDDRLAGTPEGKPARLLESLGQRTIVEDARRRRQRFDCARAVRSRNDFLSCNTMSQSRFELLTSAGRRRHATSSDASGRCRAGGHVSWPTFGHNRQACSRPAGPPRDSKGMDGRRSGRRW